ncbi:MAG: GNAT family N-acetyltransferase [Ignavibacteria bacterium]|nr:GNAT family N-acetyltransferase [Ignavibacteria bacterium]
MITKRFDPSVRRRDSFDCGEDTVNDFMMTKAKQWTKKGLSACWILEGDQRGSIAGFYTLSALSIPSEQALKAGSKDLPQAMDIPAILIGQLGVDKGYQGKGYGTKLLMDSLKRVLSNQDIAWSCVIVDALNDRVARWYEEYGFKRVSTEPIRLAIARTTVQKLIL